MNSLYRVVHTSKTKIMKAKLQVLNNAEMKNIIGAPYGYFDKKCKCFMVLEW